MHARVEITRAMQYVIQDPLRGFIFLYFLLGILQVYAIIYMFTRTQTQTQGAKKWVLLLDMKRLEKMDGN